MSEVQPAIPVQVKPPPTFGDLEAKSQASISKEATPPAKATETKTDQKPDPKAATAAKEDPAKPVESTVSEGDKKPEDPVETAGDKKPETEEKKDTVAPEKYDLKLSEKSLLNAAAVEKIAAYAKAQGLSQVDAQALVKSQEGELASAMAVAVEERKTQWLEECKSDKEIGGSKLTESVTLANDMLDKYADESFRKELSAGGFGNHPGLVKMLARIGKASENDKAIIPKTTETKVVRSRAEVLYDKTK